MEQDKKKLKPPPGPLTWPDLPQVPPDVLKQVKEKMAQQRRRQQDEPLHTDKFVSQEGDIVWLDD